MKRLLFGDFSFSVFSVFLLLCALSPALRGQAVNATLAGKISDASGASIAKASVTVSNTATGFSRAAQSSDTGDYTIAGLPAGDYTVAVDFTGFGKQEKTVTLQVGESASLDFSLTPGTLQEKVEVSATA